MTKPPRRADGLIFDLDGTLIDSFADVTTAVNATRAHYALAPLPLPEVKRNVGNGSPWLVQQTVPVPAAEQEAALAHFYAQYEAHACDQTTLLPGVEAVLAHYADRTLAVVTNKVQHLSEVILAHLGVAERFQCVLGGDVVERRKPDLWPLQQVMQRYGLAPERVVMVGDGLQDLQAGQAAGVVTIAVATGVEPREVLATAHPDHLLESLHELPAVVA